MLKTKQTEGQNSKPNVEEAIFEEVIGKIFESTRRDDFIIVMLRIACGLTQTASFYAFLAGNTEELLETEIVKNMKKSIAAAKRDFENKKKEKIQ